MPGRHVRKALWAAAVGLTASCRVSFAPLPAAGRGGDVCLRGGAGPALGRSGGGGPEPDQGLVALEQDRVAGGDASGKSRSRSGGVAAAWAVLRSKAPPVVPVSRRGRSIPGIFS